MPELLRRAIPSDLDAIDRLICAVKIHMHEMGILQWDNLYPTISHFEEDLNNGDLYVLIRDGRLVSIAALNEIQNTEYLKVDWNYRDGRICVFHRLCVDPRLQGQGIGKAMLLRLEQSAVLMNFNIVRLDTFHQNFIALQLYDTSGYVRAGKVHFRKGTFYCFEKQL